MKAMRKRAALMSAAVGVVAAAAGTGLADATVAAPQVSTKCATGVYAGYCGTQVNSGVPALSIAVSGLGKVIATSHVHGAKGDWFWFAYNGGSTKIAEYAPNGVASNLVMAQVGNHIVLQRATGAANQQWTFTCAASCGPIYTGTWTNLSSGDVISANGDGGRVVPESPSATPTSDENWTFTS
jgi:hypothetical protein